MRHIRVTWRHGHADEPVELFSELDADSREVRKVERFGDGSWGWADANGSSSSTSLGIEPVPPLAEININPEFSGWETSPAKFADFWQLARSCDVEKLSRLVTYT